jgi:mannose-1-phosphate guanylyltransferase/mannose-6-phosphate isomerase
MRVGDLIAAFETHAPDLVAPCRSAIAGQAEDLGFFRLGAEAYGQARAISFDYAIMEKADRVMAVPLPGGWSDLGAWDALWQAAGPDDRRQRAEGGRARARLPRHLPAVRGRHDRARRVGLRGRGRRGDARRGAGGRQVPRPGREGRGRHAARREVAQADDYPRFHRPWGWYETLCMGDRFQVKRIMVKPGGVLSLQSHHHRSEHWIVVAGTAEVTVGDEVKLLTENESVYIPLGATHRMANPGKLPMYLIEVQTGSYLGEDDIVRYEDIYNRA